MRISVRFCAALMAACFCSASAMANDITYQTSAVTEERLPMSYPELKQQLTYPESWLSGNVKDFTVWKTEVRQKLLAMLLTPDSHRDFAPVTIEREERDGYVAEKVAFNITVRRQSLLA